MPAKAEKAPSEEKGFVRYIGLSTRRGIVRSDVKPLGLDMPDDLWWTPENAYIVKRELIPDDVYQRAIAPDPEFVLSAPDTGKE